MGLRAWGQGLTIHERFYIRVNYLKYNHVELPQSAWCSIPFTESESRGELHVLSLNFGTQDCQYIENVKIFVGTLYMMLAATTVYFVIPLLIVSILYSR